MYVSDRLCLMMITLVNPNFITVQNSEKGVKLTHSKKAEEPIIKTSLSLPPITKGSFENCSCLN